MPRDVRDASGTKYLVPGAFAFLMGAAIVFVALGWLPVDPSRLRAPRWVIGVSGGVSVWGTRFSDEAVGRTIFGIGAVLTGAFALWGWVYGIRRLLRGEP